MANTAGGGLPSWQDIQNSLGNSWNRGATAGRNFINADPTLVATRGSRAGRLGAQVTDMGQQFAGGLTGRTALGLGAAGAGLATAMSGGNFGETVGAGSGAAAGTAIAGKLIPMLARGGPVGALAAGATALALPMITSGLGKGLGGGLQNLVAGSPQAKAVAQGVEASAQSAYNPNSAGNVVDSSLEKLSKEQLRQLLLQKQAGNDNIDLQERGMNRIAFPMMNKQFELRAKMLPLDTAARLAVNTNASIGNMYNNSIAGTSDIARQIAANNPYGQVMV